MAKTIKLTKKITVLGVETDTIELCEITTRDIRALGVPLTIKANGTVEINMDICGKYLSRLSNLTDGDVDKLSTTDFTNAAYEIVAFFNPATPSTPNSASQD